MTGGQVNDAKEGKEIIYKNFFRFKVLLADRDYDTDKIREMSEKEGKIACIPPKSNIKAPMNTIRYGTKKVQLSISCLAGLRIGWELPCVVAAVLICLILRFAWL